MSLLGFMIINHILALQLILASVLNAFYDAVNQMLKKNVEKRFLLDHLDAIYLAIDELVDEGYVQLYLLLIYLWLTCF